MFKEKYLIFREGEPEPQSAEKPSGKPKERGAHSQDTAKDLLSAKSVEEKTEEVMQELYELFTRKNIPFSEEFSRRNRDATFILEAFLGDKIKAYVMKKISDGYEFGGYSDRGITLNWWMPEPEKEMVTEINPSFLDKKVSDVLNEETKKLIAKAKQEILEKKLNRQIKPIFEELVRQNMISPTFTFEQFIKSDFAQDLRDLAKVNYYTPPTAYTWEITRVGVSFTPSEEITKAGFPDVIELKIKDYDSNLNYKIPVSKFLKDDGGDDAQEMDDEDEISEEQEYDEDLQACEDDLDVMSAENKDLEKIHFEVIKPEMAEIENIIVAGKGLPYSEIRAQVDTAQDELFFSVSPNLKEIEEADSLDDDYDGNTDSGSEQLVEDYVKKFEEWKKTLYAKYKIPLYPDDEDFE